MFVAQTVTIGEQKVCPKSESLKFSATPTPQVENPSDSSTPTPQPWFRQCAWFTNVNAWIGVHESIVQTAVVG